MTKKKILVAMSGGVDSSVTAALLKEQGHEVAGATIRTWSPDTCAVRNTRACCGLTGVEDAREVAETLGIPYWVFNFEKQFKKYVVDQFANEYKEGRTPNPCISCNEHIKFRLFLKRARQLGFDSIATGHYAQIGFDETRGLPYIAEGKDVTKDQSYVLFPLAQDLLHHLFLPVGGFTKVEIRAKARELGLCVMDKPDSQEICFIPSNDYGSFLDTVIASEAKQSAQIASAALQPRNDNAGTGIIRMQSGEVMGTHPGYYHFTRGQRRGLGVAYSERLYVVATDPEKNEVIVGKKADILSQSCVVDRINWFLRPTRLSSPPPVNVIPAEAGIHESGSPIKDFGDDRIRAHVKIRSQHEKAPATLTLLPDGSVRVDFDEPQEAITPGQGAVFYAGPRVFGGGWITDEKRTPT